MYPGTGYLLHSKDGGMGASAVIKGARKAVSVESKTVPQHRHYSAGGMASVQPTEGPGMQQGRGDYDFECECRIAILAAQQAQVLVIETRIHLEKPCCHCRRSCVVLAPDSFSSSLSPQRKRTRMYPLQKF